MNFTPPCSAIDTNTYYMDTQSIFIRKEAYYMCTDSFYTIPQSMLEYNLEKVLDLIDSGFGPIQIVGDNGKSYLLLSLKCSSYLPQRQTASLPN